MLMVPSLRLVAPNHIYRKVPTRRPNAEMRTREYLTPDEVEKLIAAAKLGRHGHRDAIFRHGLRAVEIADLEWSQVEWGRNPALHVRRAKNGKPAVHPIRAMNCACCASCSGIRLAHSCSRLSAAARLPLTPSTAS